mgnify:CR=1 FL=1
MIEVEHKQMGIVIEIKYAENVKALDQACEKALKQIKEKHYDQKLEEEGYETILNYGIACYKKRCKVFFLRMYRNNYTRITFVNSCNLSANS